MNTAILYQNETRMLDLFFVNRRDRNGQTKPLPYRLQRESGKIKPRLNQKYICYPVHVPFGGSMDALHSAAGDIGREIHGLRSRHGYGTGVNVLVTEQPAMLIVPRVDPKDLEYQDRPKIKRVRQMLIGQAFDGMKTEPLIIDLDSPASCHILLGASSGGGKSNMLRQMILSCCESSSPEDLQIALVDIDGKALGMYQQLPHCCAYVTAIDETITLLRHFEKQLTGKENSYRTRTVIVIDECAALFSTGSDEKDKEFRRLLKVFGDRGRAYGFSLLVGVQNPTDSSIPAEVRYNLNVRVAGFCNEASRSEIVLDKGNKQAASITMPGVFFAKISNKIQMTFSYLIKDDVALAEIARIKAEYDRCDQIELIVGDESAEDLLPQSAIDAAVAELKKYDNGNSFRPGYIMPTKRAIADALGRKSVTGNAAPLFDRYLEFVVGCYRSGNY